MTEKKEVPVTNINHIRLSNGEEIFGHVEELDHGIAVHTPLQTTEMEDPDGALSVGLTSYLPFADKNVCVFNDVHVITYNKVHPEIERFYFLSCHFTNRADTVRLEDISKTNLKMSDVIFNEMVTEVANGNGSTVVNGTATIN